VSGAADGVQLTRQKRASSVRVSLRNMSQNVSAIEAATRPGKGRGMSVAWTAALAGLCLLALGLRCYALNFGLPAVYNQDEVAIMNRALAFAKGDPNPHNFLYPTFYFYALFGWIGGYFVLARLLAVVKSMREFQALFFSEPTSIYVAGRLLTALCGTATVALTYRLGRRLWDWRAGVAAALFMAVAPIAVTDAHYVKHDVPVTLASVVVLLSAVTLMRAGRGAGLPWRALAAAGASLGVAGAIHYYAVFLVVPVAVAIVLVRPARPLRRVLGELLTTGAVAAVTFFACSPFVVLDWRTAARDIIANRQIVVDRAVSSARLFASGGRYLDLLWNRAVGWPVVILAGAGIVLLLRGRQWRVAALLLLFPLAFLAFISNTVAATRYLNPVLPSLALLAGFTVSQVVSLRRGQQAAAVLALVAAVPGVRLSIDTVTLFSQTDTRTLALNYIESHVQAGTTILVQPYSVPLEQSRDSLREALTARLGSLDNLPVKFALRLSMPDGPRPAYRTLFLGDGGLDLDKVYIRYDDFAGPWAIRRLVALGIEHVVLKRYNRPDVAIAPLLAALQAGGGERLAVFSPYRDSGPHVVAPFLHNTDADVNRELVRPGPIIEIWKVSWRAGNDG
jgi:uncharacterized membrane protein